MVGHSHEGNIDVEAINLGLGRKVDNLVTLGTPARSDYQLNARDSVVNWINVSNLKDKVQLLGGGFTAPAGRDQPEALNLHIDVDLGFFGSHSVLHTPQVWDLVLPYLKAVSAQ